MPQSVIYYGLAEKVPMRIGRGNFLIQELPCINAITDLGPIVLSILRWSIDLEVEGNLEFF